MLLPFLSYYALDTFLVKAYIYYLSLYNDFELRQPIQKCAKMGNVLTH
jgi:hypothetical protein